jgi:hypothetical protein
MNVKVSLCGLMAVILMGCTPDYNWREQTVADERAMIAFPSRVQTELRPIQFDAMMLNFSLTTAAVGPAVFAVGYAALPPDVNAMQTEALVKGVVASLFARGGQTVTPQALKGEVFELQTTVAKQASWMMARVIVHRGMLIQVVASGPTDALPREQAIEFMRSLVLK